MKRIAIFASHNGSGFDTLYQASKEKQLDITIVLVISNNSTSKIIEKATTLNISNYIVNNKQFQNTDKKIFELLQKYKCDYIFLSGYMKKISSLISNNFKVLNSHPSLLPHYGGIGMYGRFVHQAVIKNKEEISGVTIHEVNEQYDEGKIIIQKQLSLKSDETVDSLEKKIKDLEKIAIIEGFQICLK